MFGLADVIMYFYICTTTVGYDYFSCMYRYFATSKHHVERHRTAPTTRLACIYHSILYCVFMRCVELRSARAEEARKKCTQNKLMSA